ncbi:MAG: hypothetical protein BZY88_10525 [SAR202 cluster bacterium Io17-Chloro-G9]|nr:MAG: hypothetical protein BZY88_10525 [SAR202 cluster bacterium Io17-Chloro-G9]
MVAGVAGLGMFLGAMDIAVNVGLPSITEAFNTDLETVQWVIVSFVATRAGLVMGAGSFADRFGLREVYIFGAMAYLVAMVAIALSPNLASVVGFRVLQALGTGCLFAVSPAIAVRVFPAHRRGLSMGLATASQALGMLAGTLGAGLLVQWTGWQAVFLGRVPFVAVALLLAILFMSRESPTGPKASFDAAGAALLMAALICLVVGLRLGRSDGWDHPAVLALLPMAPLLLGIFWHAEGRAQWPVLPREFLRVRGVIFAGSSMFLMHLGVFVIWFIFPFYISDALGRGPLTLGIMLAMMAVLNAIFSGVGGWLCDKAGTVSVGMGGLIVLTGGLLYLGFLDGDSSLAQVAIRMGAVGAGMGLFQASAFTLMMNSVTEERYGTAAGSLSLTQAFGTVLSIAAIGGIFTLSEDHHLAGVVSTGAATTQAAERAFIMAFQDVFRLGAAIVALAGCLFFFSPRRR